MVKTRKIKKINRHGMIQRPCSLQQAFASARQFLVPSFSSTKMLGGKKGKKGLTFFFFFFFFTGNLINFLGGGLF
jgi:hypothetical protein